MAAIGFLRPDKRPWPTLGVAVGISGIIALSEWRSRQIDEAEKAEESREVDRLKNEVGLCDQRLAEETAKIRAEYEQRVKDLVEDKLADLHAEYFRNETNDEEKYKHRSTLFKCVEGDSDPDSGKKLVIYTRHGRYKTSTCSWPVDEDDPEKCRGVAGQIWFHGSIKTKTADCDWPSDPNDLTNKAKYAESLGISVDEAEGLNVKSRVFAGVMVTVRGNKWGVILLDSLKEGQIQDGRREKKLLSDYAVLISSLLERMES